LKGIADGEGAAFLQGALERTGVGFGDPDLEVPIFQRGDIAERGAGLDYFAEQEVEVLADDGAVEGRGDDGFGEVAAEAGDFGGEALFFEFGGPQGLHVTLAAAEADLSFGFAELLLGDFQPGAEGGVVDLEKRGAL
jgi:hypothetical protein